MQAMRGLARGRDARESQRRTNRESPVPVSTRCGHRAKRSCLSRYHARPCWQGNHHRCDPCGPEGPERYPADRLREGGERRHPPDHGRDDRVRRSLQPLLRRGRSDRGNHCARGDGGERQRFSRLRGFVRDGIPLQRLILGPNDPCAITVAPKAMANPSAFADIEAIQPPPPCGARDLRSQRILIRTANAFKAMPVP